MVYLYPIFFVFIPYIFFKTNNQKTRQKKKKIRGGKKNL